MADPFALQSFKKLLFLTMVTTILWSCKLLTAFAEEEGDPKFEVMYEWKAINYSWDSLDDGSAMRRYKNYIPINNAISGVKIWKDRAYLTVPRWRRGVPSTLNWVPICDAQQDPSCPRSPPLTPFPSWEMQEPGNCSAIQYVQAVEIDPLGRMWVLDVGRRNILSPLPDNRCKAKLILLDLEGGGRVIHTYEFPDRVAPRLDSFLNDLVVDVNGNSPDGSDWFAYITDSGGVPTLGGGIVVYSLGTDESWRVTDLTSMRARIPSSFARVGGSLAILAFNVDGIAMSPKGRRDPQVYYSPLGSRGLYSLPVTALRNSKDRSAAPFVRYYGRKKSQSDGMMMDSEGNLYFGLLTLEGMGVVNDTALESTNGEYVGEDMLFMDPERLQWVDGLGFDNDGSLWFITNRLQNLEFFNVDLKEVNYRLNRFRTGTKSYMN
ncbi:protein yellow-like [Ischnura elegans]|uniref:protein yellow-like n=1 Tax=Ischnura elegans TaxID=197161 RepID=UPI001ED89FC5|nr:protein yellow-like [Ischnura elegans]XP_046386735.1 protein yellow-like [Ischnura elegans]XP_046386736.1 protein yellow-like [Ischnura elegans]